MTAKVDIGLAFGYSVFFILVIASDITYLLLHDSFESGKVHAIFVEWIIGIKAIVLLAHLIIYTLLYKVRGLRRKLHQYIIYWELFMIAVGTHLCSMQEFYTDDEDDHDAKHEGKSTYLLILYSFWRSRVTYLENIYSLGPVSDSSDFYSQKWS